MTLPTTLPMALISRPPRQLFFTGKGGVGKTSIACAAATYFQYDTLAVAWLTQFYPNGQIGL